MSDSAFFLFSTLMFSLMMILAIIETPPEC